MNVGAFVPHLIAATLLLLEGLVLLAIATGQPAWVLIPLTWATLPVAQSLHAVTRTTIRPTRPQE